METDGSDRFDQVYRANRDAVYRFCLSQLRDRALAEDVAADVFASAWSASSAVDLDDAAGTRSWIFRIARNATVDQYRRQAARRGLLDRLRGRGGSADVESIAALRHDLRAVLQAVAGLPVRDRTLVGLRIAAGLSYAEIATVMGMTETAAKAATHRALQRVREHVRPSDSASAGTAPADTTAAPADSH